MQTHETKFKQLQALGAGDFEHLNGSLEAHLKNTAAILADWGASETLQTAGLFHAAYGTAGFDVQMVSTTQRDKIASVIGKAAEALVYLYCACDRDYVFRQFEARTTDKPTQVYFKDRFTHKTYDPSVQQIRDFCELTVANELELVYGSQDFKRQYGNALLKLFNGMTNHLSEKAISAYLSALSS